MIFSKQCYENLFFMILHAQKIGSIIEETMVGSMLFLFQ